jgi:hypothetical protein
MRSFSSSIRDCPIIFEIVSMLKLLLICFFLYTVKSQIVCQKNILLRWRRQQNNLKMNFASLSFFGFQVLEINSNYGNYPCKAFKCVSFMDNFILYNFPVSNVNKNCSRVSLSHRFEDTNQKPLQIIPEWLETTWNVNFTQFVELFESNATVHLTHVRNGKPMIGNDSLLSLDYDQKSSFKLDFTICTLILFNFIQSTL